MKRLVSVFAALVAVSLLAGCGGGGGGSDLGEPVSVPASLQGTYRLSGFLVEYSDGTSIDETSDDIQSWTGTMVITEDTMTQDITINGTRDYDSGSVTVSWVTQGESGIFHTVMNGQSRDLRFSIAGNVMEIYSGERTIGDDLTAEEWDTWTKTAD